jgi:nucleotide-binding universal stress UspA family protein
MKRIVVPHDFSVQAQAALEVAVVIAKQTKAEVILTHIIETPVRAYADAVTGAASYVLDSELLAEDRESAKRKLAMLTRSFDGVKFFVSVLARDGESISEKILEKDADLIVMGTKGASGLKEIFVGSNTEKVVRHATCPVLTVHKGIADYKIKNIVFPVDLRALSDDVAQKIKDFAQLFSAKVHLLYVITPATLEHRGDIQKEFAIYKPKYGFDAFDHHIVESTNEEVGIINFATSNKADLIVMPTHGRVGLSHLLMGSITEDVVNHSPIPVLSFKTKKEQ